MLKSMSSNDAKQQWGTLMASVSRDGDEVIVESHGKPKAVVVPVAAYEELTALREQHRRAEALRRITELQQRLALDNAGNSENEEIEFAERLSHELIDDMAARGEITFERDLR